MASKGKVNEQIEINFITLSSLLTIQPKKSNNKDILKNNSLRKTYRKLVYLTYYFFGCILLVAIFMMLLYFNAFSSFSSSDASEKEMSYEEYIPKVKEYDGDVFGDHYDVSILDDSPESEIIKYGYELFQNTPKYVGPDNGNPDNIYAGNRLSCNNCHLKSGTKPFSGPLIGIIQRFPQYRGREDKMGTIEERINGCFERSMNGRVLPEDSGQMKAYIAYLKWLSRYAPENGTIKGQGFVSVEIPNRPVDLEQGEKIYNTKCYICHGLDGQGQFFEDGMVYRWPPLWGENSFNNGAGMTRVITAMRFIKGNMPYGATNNFPILTDEEAYDVAGFISQKERPVKPNLDADFPDLTRKPVSTGYPPYVDNFSISQHQLGPFQPIMEFYKKKYNMIKKK